MNLALTIIAILMLADASFALLNLTKVESLLKSVFPKMNIRRFAIVEGVVGGGILIIKIATKTIM